MKWIRVLLIAIAIVCVANPAGAGKVRRHVRDRTDVTLKQPYLIFTGDNTRMEVLWQLTDTASSTIEWGADTTYGAGSAVTSETGTDHQHAYTIAGLSPGENVSYRVTTNGVSHAGTFRAAPQADASALKFIAYGDTRSNPDVHDQLAERIEAACAEDPGYRTLAILTGDLVYSDTEADWTDQLFSPAYPHIRALMAGCPVQSTMGNHEGAGTLFVKYLPYPFVEARYWSFDYGPAHFTVMDQFTPYTPGSAQLEWIAADLEASQKPWKFIVLHQPGWSAGGGHTNNSSVQTYIQPLCLQYGVSLVFGGHNHYYARADVNGVQHLTVGGGGAPLYTPNPVFPFVVASARAYHFCKIAIAGGTLRFEAVGLDGAVLDSFELHMPAAVAGGGLRPGLALAQPNPFREETEISWSVPNGPVRLLITDIAGRLVRTFPPGGPGTLRARWDGRDDAGLRVASGMYYGRLESGADRRLVHLLFLK